MARLLFAGLLAFAVFLQTVILPSLNLIQVLPDVSLVLLLVWSAIQGVPEGLVWAFGLGILIDVLALDPMGTNALAFLGVALLGGLARRRFFQSNLVFPILLAVAATVVHAVVLLLLRSSDGGGLPLASVSRFVFLQALLNSICVPPLYLVAGAMGRRTVIRRA